MYYVLCIKRCDLNSCFVNFCNLKFCSKSVVSDIVITKFPGKQKKEKSILIMCHLLQFDNYIILQIIIEALLK